MYLIYFLIFIIGLGFGSFASVIIHRLHTKDRGILWGRSKCPYCTRTLAARDLMPIVSFLINKFKCRFCKKPISFKYPILEIVMGTFFLITTILTGFNQSYLLVYYLLITFVFVVITFYDIFFQEIPDEISLPTILLVGLIGYFGQLHSLADLLIGFSVPVLFFGALFLLSAGRWLGGGDVRIGAIMGLILGWPLVLIGLFLGYLLGTVYSIIGLLTKKLTRKSPIPFGPFLLLGTYVTMFWGNDILSWYLGML